MNIEPLLRLEKVGVERSDWSEISDDSPSFKALWAQRDSLRVENGLLKRVWESSDGKHSTTQLVVAATRTKAFLF